MWGIIFGIATTFGGGAVFIVDHLLTLERRLTVNEGLKQQVDTNIEAIKVVNVRVDNQEGRIFDLTSRINNQR